MGANSTHLDVFCYVSCLMKTFFLSRTVTHLHTAPTCILLISSRKINLFFNIIIIFFEWSNYRASTVMEAHHHFLWQSLFCIMIWSDWKKETRSLCTCAGAHAWTANIATADYRLTGPEVWPQGWGQLFLVRVQASVTSPLERFIY